MLCVRRDENIQEREGRRQGLPGEILHPRIYVQRLEARRQRANHKHGRQCVRHPQHRARAEGVEAEGLGRFKKTEKTTSKVNVKYLTGAGAGGVEAEMVCWEQTEAAELDEMWSFAQNKGSQCWPWLAIDRKTSAVLAYAFGRRQDKEFRELKALLESFGISMSCTGDWGGYIDASRHTVGKKHTQAIERKNLTFRTRIKRLSRRTICFSKSVAMRDIVVGLVINILEFG